MAIKKEIVSAKHGKKSSRSILKLSIISYSPKKWVFERNYGYYMCCHVKFIDDCKKHLKKPTFSTFYIKMQILRQFFQDLKRVCSPKLLIICKRYQMRDSYSLWNCIWVNRKIFITQIDQNMTIGLGTKVFKIMSNSQFCPTWKR